MSDEKQQTAVETTGNDKPGIVAGQVERIVMRDHLLLTNAPIRMNFEHDNLCKNCTKILKFDCDKYIREFDLINGKKAIISCDGFDDYTTYSVY